MNDMIKQLTEHRSFREFDHEREVEDHQVNAIIQSAMAAPNWINGQQVTIIEVRDSQLKEKLAKAAGNQVHVAEAPVFFVFCLDFRRAKLAAEKNGTDFKIIESIEAVIIGSTDVGIAIGSAVAAAESIGLGTVPIGGLRRAPHAVIDLLNLPEYVFPVAGLSAGYPVTKPEKKPRLPVAVVHHKEQYQCNKTELKHIIDDYDDAIAAYNTERSNGKINQSWSEKVAGFYSNGIAPYCENVPAALRQQGFKIR